MSKPSSESGSPQSSRIWRIAGWIVVAILAAVVLGSLVFETLIPLLRAGDVQGFVRSAIGIPLMLGGAILIIYGGFLFVRNTLRPFVGDEEFRERMRVINQGASEEVREARRENLATLWGAWKPALLRIAAGFTLIVAGGLVLNL